MPTLDRRLLLGSDPLLRPDSDPHLKELDALIAALQNWANIAGDFSVPRNLILGGSFAAVNQPAFRGFIEPSLRTIPTGVSTTLTWTTVSLTSASAVPSELNCYQTGGIAFDGQRVFLKDPGFYHVQARVRWDGATVAGTTREVNVFCLSAAGTSPFSNEFADRVADLPIALGLVQKLSVTIRVTDRVLEQYNVPSGLPVWVEVLQDAGVNETLRVGSWFSVNKVG